MLCAGIRHICVTLLIACVMFAILFQRGVPRELVKTSSAIQMRFALSASGPSPPTQSSNETETFNSLFIDGNWVFRPEKEYDAPICRENQYVHHPKMYEQDPSTPLSFGGACYSGQAQFLAHFKDSSCRCTATQKWRWEASSLPPFDPHRFCSLLGNRTFLMIGDSTMAQTASTIMNAVFPAGCQVQMTMCEADTLVGKKMGHHNRGFMWTHYVDVLQPDVVMLSAGAHIFPEGQNSRSTVDPNAVDRFDTMLDTVVKDTLRYRATAPNRLILWKTQNPAGCSENISDGINYPDYNGTSSWFNFHLFRARDGRAVTKLQRYNIPIIDVRMLYNRSDAHPYKRGKKRKKRRKRTMPDCLHFCVPGPLDVIPPLVQQKLTQHANKISSVFGNVK